MMNFISVRRPTNKEDVFYEVVIIGDSTVGKTCILRSFSKAPFMSNTSSTSGVDHTEIALKISRVNNETSGKDHIIPVYVLANKIDLNEERVVNRAIAEEFSKQYEGYFEVSARTGKGIDNALDELAKFVLTQRNPARSIEGFESIEQVMNQEIRLSKSCHCNCKNCQKCVVKNESKSDDNGRKRNFFFLKRKDGSRRKFFCI
ncbi:DgyrCDS3818 [Dimorphilus gyrociliatus]|uniref:DgyrCDS3818 n=1 Tax=Dimorphilus gyrociliatus TaxID=2664684 RepID=A0A7I8VES9_9ANNE|nr:DgyrCDS3818 [Dimorphilus gyrociliatus]